VKYLTKKIETALLRVNAEHPQINDGGCGAFARVLGRYLSEMGYQVQYKAVYRMHHSIQQGNEAVSNREYFSWFYTSWTHIVVIVNGKIIDSSGIYKKLYEHNNPNYASCYLGDPFPPEALDKILSAEYKHEWNHMFNRSTMGAIAKKLRKYLDMSN
jgi:hypothetical protein